MANASRRVLLFTTAAIGGLGLLAALMLLFARPPRPVAPSPPPGTPTPRTVATVDDEPVFFDEWQRAVALDQAMSGLTDQTPPDPEETLNRLINQRLVLHAAAKAGILEGDRAEAEAWLASFSAGWNLEETALEQALTRVGLTRVSLVEEIVPRLLQVEQALDELPPNGDDQVWMGDLRHQARVVLLEHLSAPQPLDVLALTAEPALPASPSPSQPTPVAVSPPAGSRVGELAADFSLKTVDGTLIRLFDLRGKVVLLDFWAAWCTPCLNELRMLEAAQSDGLIVLGIAVRESPEKVSAFATESELELPLLLDPEGFGSDAYQVHGLPTSLLVDREGLIVARHVGPLDQDTLDSYLTSSETIP